MLTSSSPTFTADLDRVESDHDSELCIMLRESLVRRIARGLHRLLARRAELEAESSCAILTGRALASWYAGPRLPRKAIASTDYTSADLAWFRAPIAEGK